MNLSYGPHIVALFSLCQLPFVIQKNKKNRSDFKMNVNAMLQFERQNI